MTFCGKCGSKNPDTSEFCWSCGAKISIPGAFRDKGDQNPEFIERYPSPVSQNDATSGSDDDSKEPISVVVAGEVGTGDAEPSPKSDVSGEMDEEMHRVAAAELMSQADELRKQAEVERKKANEIKIAMKEARSKAEALEDQERMARYTAEDRKRIEDATRVLEENEREKEKKREERELERRRQKAIGGKAALTILFTIISSLLILSAFLLCGADCITSASVQSQKLELGTESVHLVDLGLGGIGGIYTFFTFFTLFCALLGLYSPVSSAIASLLGFMTAAMLKSVSYRFSEAGYSLDLSMTLDGMGVIWAALLIAFIMSIASLYCLSRCSDITRNSLSDTLRLIWKGLWGY